MLAVRVGTTPLRVSGVPFEKKISKVQTVRVGRPRQQPSQVHRTINISCRGTKNQDFNTGFMSRLQRMSEKHDFLSAFVGSIVVTGYFVSVHGQDVGTALGITSMATVVAVLLEEFLFNSSP